MLRAYGDTASDEEGLVTSLLLPDAPVVVWWPDICPDGSEHLAARARSPSDGSRMPPRTPIRSRPCAASARNYAPGDTDFAWTRLTLWRAQLAAVLDQPPYEPVTGVTVSGSADSPSTELLAAWLQLQLEVPVELDTTDPGAHERDPRCAPRTRRRARSTSTRGQDNIATLMQPDQPTHSVSLPRRNLRDCLAEELRRLDPDDLFGEVVQKGLGLLDAPTEKSNRTAVKAQAVKGSGKKVS